jgi:hypothetical protein
MQDAPRGSLFLFVVALLCAVALMATAAAGPHLIAPIAEPHDVLLLFGKDMTVRRTAFASSLGLLATAFVFFRPTAKAKKKPVKDSVNMTGA